MVTLKKRYRKKRLSKRGGVDNNLPANINIPVNLNEMPMEESTSSQGSLHLSDLNVTDDSMASGITTVESMSPDSFSPNNSFASNGGKKRRKTSKKRKNSKSKSKRRRSKSKRRLKKRGGADQADEDTSPVSNMQKYNDMISYFN